MQAIRPCLAVATALALAAPPLQAAEQRPNIVLIVLDDVGMSDLGAFGGEIATPVMDRMAKEGVRFTNFHVAAACSPTRAMLYTGVDNHVAGVGTLENIVADNQKGKPGYEGYLNDRVLSIGTLLSRAGYRTYFSGKWNLGDTADKSPASQGFQQSVALAQTGSDNYQSKPYAPIHDASRWFEGGKEIALPKDFYSTRYYVDRMIGFLNADKGNAQPFLSVVALQANHYPHQAPKPFIDRYMGRYDAGWDAIRAERYARQVQMGLFPGGAAPRRGPTSQAWDSLDAASKRDYAKRMAVYAGMLDAADTHIGRLRDYLKAAGKLDNTVFIVLSDNGADPYRLDKVFWYWYPFNYSTDYETLGEKGSFSAYGLDWAQVSNTPGYLYKGNAAEGGVRTPLIVSWPARFQGGRISDTFTHVKDIVPTLLELAGAPLPGGAIAVPDGSSMLSHLDGRSARVHAPDQPIGYEMAGNAALYKGDLKLVKDLPPFGDNAWHLYDVRRDPTESHDLQASEPEAFRTMQSDLQAYFIKNGVIALPADYAPIRQLVKNNWATLLRMLWPVLLTLVAILLAVVGGIFYLWRRWRIMPAHA
ncbi:MAG: arylsulfatase [Pseudomonadota bacterium]